MSALEPSYLEGSGGMLPRQILKTGTSKNAIIASKTLKCDRKVNQNLRVQIVRNFFLPRNLCRNFFSWPSALHEFFFRCDSSAGNFVFNSSKPPPQRSNGPPLSTGDFRGQFGFYQYVTKIERASKGNNRWMWEGLFTTIRGVK